jgi:uncharacterized iron-regulated membrane protein
MSALRILHRWLSLALAALWLVQVVSGVALVFRWELDDGGVRGPAGPLDVPALASRLEALQHRFPTAPVQLYASGGDPGRFDVLVQRAPGRLDDLRVDGRGEVLRWRPWNYDYGHVGVLTFTAWLHDTLFAGVAAPWLLSLSGIVLLSNIALGLKLAWPRRRAWRRALAPNAPSGGGRRLFAWHRATGLWAGSLAAILVASGVATALDAPLRNLLHADHPEPARATTSMALSGAPVGPAGALRIGLAHYPAAQLYSLVFPSPERPWFRVGLRQPGESERFAGTTAVYVAQDGGHVLLDDDALKDSARTRALDAMYAIHTGEILGPFGRVLALMAGAALAGLIVIGLCLWSVRRRLRRPRQSDVEAMLARNGKRVSGELRNARFGLER